MGLKRILSYLLTVPMLFGLITACSGNDANVEQQSAEITEPAQPGEEGRYLKVLTLGHSLAVDSNHMLCRIADAEGYKGLKIATLYYSGCYLSQHVQYLKNNEPIYNLYISSTDEPATPPAITNGVTMEYALQLDYWDIIVMQGGVFEIADDSAFKNGNIQTIRDYVKQMCLNPNAQFAWHMHWAPPVTDSLRDQYTYSDDYYRKNYRSFGDNRDILYSTFARCVENNILTDKEFAFLIPTGTAMENALTSYLEETDLHRDFVHATDLARVMHAYLWYCKLTGVQELNALKMDTIPVRFFNSIQDTEDRVLTDAEKAIILESVNNALKNPLKVTQSQYTVKP